MGSHFEWINHKGIQRISETRRAINSERSNSWRRNLLTFGFLSRRVSEAGRRLEGTMRGPRTNPNGANARENSRTTFGWGQGRSQEGSKEPQIRRFPHNWGCSMRYDLNGAQVERVKFPAKVEMYASRAKNYLAGEPAGAEALKRWENALQNSCATDSRPVLASDHRTQKTDTPHF